MSVLELFSLSGQTAVVTGGSRGLGQAMAVALAEAGADIILLQRDTTNTTTQDLIQQRTTRTVKIHHFDLTDKANLTARFTEILTQASPAPTILLNSGGIQRRHPTTDFPLSHWNEVLDVNLTATFVLCQAFGAHLLSRPAGEVSCARGKIINIASLLTFQGGLNVPAYAASKGGVGQLTKALANEWAGRGINVNAIAPGYIATEMNADLRADEVRERQILERIPQGRWGSAEDFRGVVVWLASRAADYVNGEVVTVDGGWMGR